MNKNIEFANDAKAGILKGVDKLAKAVTSTLGPKGRTVVIEKEGGFYSATKDGVSVAEVIKFEDKLEDAGAQMVKEVASQVNDEAGDGTTTATVLAHDIVTEGFKAVESGANPVDIKRGMDKAVDVIIDKLDDAAKVVSTYDEIKQVASISANSDEKVGYLIANAIDEVGTDGVVTVENSNTHEDELEIVEGMQLDKGYLSPYFVNNQTEMIAQYENPYILLVDEQLNDIKKLVKVLEYCIQIDKPLVIVAPDITGDALAGLIVNNARGTLKCCAVKAPAFGDKRTDILEDLAIITGGTVISSKKAMHVDKFDPEWLGTAKTVTANSQKCVFVDGPGTKDQIEDRIQEIKTLIDQSTSHYEIELMQKRLGKLSGGVAIIKIGAHSELELKEKKDRVEDSLNATRAALDDGIIEGGGVALINCAVLQSDDDISNDISGTDQAIGWDIVMNSLRTPLKAIVHNAGINFTNIYNNIVNSDKPGHGYDVSTEKYVNMFDAGIIDPVKVTKTALTKAVSVAGTILMTEAVITNIDEEEAAPSYM